MFQRLDSVKQDEKQGAAWTEWILKLAGILAAAMIVFGILYAGMLMME